MSQNIIECGRRVEDDVEDPDRLPMSTKMKSMHMITAAMARNSPRIVILPNAL